MSEKPSVYRRVIRGEDGPTATEYTVMLSVIIIVCITALSNTGRRSGEARGNVASQIKGPN
ncbi:MAG: Flp family type IVb pilin [Planctomycetota bacterium]|jgi:pilus assembly protein Flp/PilA